MEQEETMIVDGMIDFSSIEEQSIDICWTSAVEALRKIQQESLIIQDYNSYSEQQQTIDTFSETSSLQPPQVTTHRSSKASSSSREQSELCTNIAQTSTTGTINVTTLKVLPSFSSSVATQLADQTSHTVGRTRPVRAARLVKPDRFIAVPAVCTKRTRRADRVVNKDEEENSEVKPTRHKRLSYKDDDIPESPFKSPLSDKQLLVMVKEQAGIISSPLSDTHCLQESVLTLFYIIENRPDSTGLMQNSGVYRTILELLRLIDDEELLYRVMLVLTITVKSCDTSVVLHLVEGGVVPLTLPHCHSNCSKVRLQVICMIGNIGASELKGEVATLEVIQTVAQSYSSSEARISHRYACTLQILTKDCSQQQARMMIPFIPVLKCIIPVETSVIGVQYACSALSSLLKSKEETIVDVMLNADIVSTLLEKLQDSRVKVVWIVLNLLIDISDSCNCKQVLLLQLVLQPLLSIIQKISSPCGNEKSAILAIECFGSISKLGAGPVAMVMRTIPTLYGTLVGLIREGLEAMKRPRAREDPLLISAASALMRAVNSAADGYDLLYFIELGCYPLAFAILRAFTDDERVQEVVSALSNMITNLPNIDLLQEEIVEMDRFDAPAGWAVVRGLTGKYTEPSSTHTYSILQLQNSINAQRLLRSAIQLGLAEEKG